MTKRRCRRAVAPALLAALLALLALPGAAEAQEVRTGIDWSEYEWEPDEGLHREEWYDPDDWFDDDRAVDVEYDGYWFDRYGATADRYRDWHWDEDRQEWVGSDYRDGAWYDTGARWYDRADYEDVLLERDGHGDGFDYEYDATSYDWNPVTRSWEVDDGADEERFDLYTEGYAAETTPEERRERRDRARRGGRAVTARLSGRITGFRNVDLLDRRSAHTLVRLRLEDGNDVVVDLGPQADVSDLDLTTGDRIRVRGQRGTIDGREVLIAREIRAGGETHEIRTESGTAPTGARSYAGRVRDYRRMALGDGADGRTFLRLVLADGEDIVVDLGPRTDLRDLDLRRGDRVAVEGRRTAVDGRSILVARSLRVEGEPAGIDRDRGWSDSRDDRRTGRADDADDHRGDRIIGRRPSGDEAPDDADDRSGRDDLRYLKHADWASLRTGAGQYRVDGFVGDWRRIRTDAAEDRTLVQICLDDGTCVVTDLGEDTTLDDLNLRRGDYLRVTGPREVVNGRAVLAAKRIAVSGRPVKR